MDTAARTELLVTEHLPWVYEHTERIVSRVPVQTDADGLISAGLLALVLSARAYDQSSDVPFIQFAAPRIHRAVLEELESAVPEITAPAPPVHLEDLPPDTAANLVRDHDRGPEDSLLHRELLQCLRSDLDALPARLRTIVVGRFLRDRPIAELADELGLSVSRVSQLTTEALQRLRSCLVTRFERSPPGAASRRRQQHDRIVPAQSQR